MIEVILIPTPSYAYLYRNIWLRSRLEFLPIDLLESSTNPEDVSTVSPLTFQMLMEKVEKTISATEKQVT